MFFFFKQKTAYEMRISDWSSDVCSSDLGCLNTPDWLWQPWCATYGEATARAIALAQLAEPPLDLSCKSDPVGWASTLGATLLPGDSLRLPPGHGDITRLAGYAAGAWWVQRSEEHTYELQSLMRTSYAVFCL